MSRRAPRGGSNPCSRQASRDNSDQENTESEAFLSYSTPIAKRKYRQHPDNDIETFSNNSSRRNSRDEYHNHSTNTTFLPVHPRGSTPTPSIASSASTTIHHHHSSSSAYSTTTTTTTTASSSTFADHLSSTATLATAAIEPLSKVVAAPVLAAAEVVSSLQQKQFEEQPPAYSKWSTIAHQLSFLATGIFSTIAVQWLYYQGAASGTTMLTVFFNYIGMMSVGLVYYLQTWYTDTKQRRLAAGSRTHHVEYDVLTTDLNEMTETHDHDLDEDDHGGVKDHIELVGKKISNINNDTNASSSSSSSSSSGSATLHIKELDDEDEDMFNEIDEEKQRLRGMHKKDLSLESSPEASATGTRGGAFAGAEKNSAGSKSWTRLHWPVIQVAVMDVIANALVTVGFFYVGSGMYQVIYSSIVIWCAILTRIFLSRKLNNIQWLAIVGVTFGLAISAVGTVQDASPDGPVQSWLEKSFGALITLGATFLYACVYVLSDKVLSTFKPKPIPEKVCSMVGFYASLFTFVYLCIHTFPNWQTEVLDVVAAHQGSWFGIIAMYPLVTISSMLHSLNYYVLLSRINNIAVGIMQSLRAVLVFVMSHYLFCGVSSTQCFNEWKFISAIVVIGCVTLFSFNSAPSGSTTESASSASGGARAKGLSPSRVASPIPRFLSSQRRNGDGSSLSPQ